MSGFPNADISVSIVWIDMLPPDNLSAAEQSALMIGDHRARHFHDPHRRAGQVVAQSLGEPGMIAWDIYLFYAAGEEWEAAMPAPVYWAHQLSATGWGDHYHWGDDCYAELYRAFQRLAGSAD